MKDRFKIVQGTAKEIETQLNNWAATMKNAKLKRTQLAAIKIQRGDLSPMELVAIVLCTYEDPQEGTS